MDRPITSIPTFDESPDRVFRLWQDAGRIPSNYGSWDELEADFLSRLKDGQSAREARKAMGVNYRSIAGSNLLESNISSTGEARGLNRRAIREDIDPLTERHIRKNYGEEKLQEFRKKLQNDWFKLSEGERRHVQSMTGAQQHRGHGNAASSGGSISINNMLPENGRRNSAHGPEPRFPQGVMDDTGMTKNYLEDFYEWDLEQQGLSRGTRPSNALAAAGDEQMVDFDSTGPRGYNRNPEAGRPPETFEMQTEKLKQLEQQGISRQTIDTYERNQSAALSIGDSTAQSGPVRQVQPPDTKISVVEDLGTGKVRKAYVPNRKALKALAAAGLAAPSLLGTAASAAETGGRADLAMQTGNPVDWLQTGISGLSLAGDFVPVVGEIVSTPADAVNMTIDHVRERNEPKQRTPDSRYQHTPEQPVTVQEYTPYVAPKKTQPSVDSARLQINNTQPPPVVQQLTQTVQKIMKDPGNELEWVRNQALGWLGIGK